MVSEVDVAVIGAGPAGHFAALTAARAGQRVVVIEQEPKPGGECVRRGTIPSKTLRAAALALSSLESRSGGVVQMSLGADVQLETLMRRKAEVIEAHEGFLSSQLEDAGVAVWHGRARFRSPTVVEVVSVSGARRTLSAKAIVIATGSRPRAPAEVPIDHEHVLDSDSILSMTYLPRSLTVLGAGVIASEYATIFQTLGVKVTMIDRAPRPLGFLDDEMSEAFLDAFTRAGGTFVGGRKLASVAFDGVEAVEVQLEGGVTVRSEKVLCALGRVANVDALGLAAAGLEPNARGLLTVDAQLRTTVPHIYAVGDVIGPPSLASASMEQGRRAIRHLLGQPTGSTADQIPAGVYTIPELSCIGVTEAAARQRGPIVVGRASFDRLARAHIDATPQGLLKLVCDGDGRTLLGVHVVGEGAAELVHLGQLAMSARLPVDAFVEGIFNFPTLAEAYRIAAMDVLRQRAERAVKSAA
jgi:NAD(P) transhydrogenase